MLKKDQTAPPTTGKVVKRPSHTGPLEPCVVSDEAALLPARKSFHSLLEA